MRRLFCVNTIVFNRNFSMNSIQALLEALKRSGGSGGMPDDDDSPGEPIAAKLSILKAVPDKGGDDSDAPDTSDMDDMFSPDSGQAEQDDAGMDQDSDQDSDQDDDQDNAMNAKIVGALQAMYPQVYDKLCKVVGSSDDDDQGGDNDLSNLGQPSQLPPGLMG
jgi:hypothetical protein